ncbi:hypothetical protein Pla108_19680 [Botrimarina colliarenosi]|uniref:DUF4185 domain-containing protein n=1 Tax=Botrimarina colliarenosi TaxID=2528001 RepID=A0A5C6AEG8_9BACT|nr:hypothetical protein [Botrimarina colliarenosi]TWT97816.1 hypothetical protein Pla108_19680 [Botrimarina colliarenosi]
MIRSVCLLYLLVAMVAAADEPFRIDVVEEGTGWPVPLVELRTTHNVRFVTDNAGVIAFDLPELMGVPTWFAIEGHGYGVAADGFGYEGVRLTPEAGGHARVTVKRKLPGKRIGRLTGGGLFGESQRFGDHPEWNDQGVLGCDSVQLAEHRGRLYWLWGDTTLAGYPLGLFHMLGATTGAHPLRSLEPPIRLWYDYFRDRSGKPRVVAEMPGSGPTWLSGLVSLPDKSGEQRLVAVYTKIRPPLAAYETGLCVWDDEQQHFIRHCVLWKHSEEDPQAPALPEGHATRWIDDEGSEWLLFGDPFPRLQCAPTFEAWEDPAAWRTLEPQPTVAPAGGGEPVTPHRGSIAWNAFRKKWIAVFTQFGGSSPLGEIWYAQSDSPLGPWGAAVKVVTHNNQTFYNPRLHPELTPADSPVVLFEGTYTTQFVDHAEPTPRYNYNQVLYRLDLDDPAMKAE